MSSGFRREARGDRQCPRAFVSGSELYLGGFLTSVGGQPRIAMAKVDATSGSCARRRARSATSTRRSR